MKCKKIFVFMMALFNIVPLIFLGSCGNEKDASVSLPEDTAQNEQSETGKQPDDNLPDCDSPSVMSADYGNKDFVILYPGWSLYNNFYFAEEQTGDPVNDSIYHRTQKTNEALGVNIKSFTSGGIETIFEELSKTAMSGTQAYDLALTHCIQGLPPMVSEGVVLNWNKVPNIDLNKDLWNKSVRKNMEINGILPFASNSFILPDVNSLFFNFDLVNSYNLENPYQSVENGSWTWDTMMKNSSEVTGDVDGDGKMTMEDRYGFVGEMGWELASIPTACDISVVKSNENGLPSLDINNEKTIKIIEWLNTMIYSEKTAFFWAYDMKYDPNDGGTPPIGFDKGNALYYLVPLSFASNFRKTEVDFGIIPLPKFDEIQQDYTTLNWAGFMVIPSTAPDPAMTGAVAEMLAYQNEMYVCPAFYDVLLGQKISRDKQSIEMLDIIFDNSIYDMGVNLGIHHVIQPCLAENSKPFESYYKSNEKVWNNNIESYYDAYEKYAGMYN